MKTSGEELDDCENLRKVCIGNKNLKVSYPQAIASSRRRFSVFSIIPSILLFCFMYKHFPVGFKLLVSLGYMSLKTFQMFIEQFGIRLLLYYKDFFDRTFLYSKNHFSSEYELYLKSNKMMLITHVTFYVLKSKSEQNLYDNDFGSEYGRTYINSCRMKFEFTRTALSLDAHNFRLVSELAGVKIIR